MRAAVLPVYYGWFVLAASAVAELLVQGATSYSAGLFVLPLQAEFHISRADANSSILILFFGSMIAAPLAGRLLDAYPIRLVVSVAAVIFGLSLAGIAATTSLWLMAAILVMPMAIAFMCLGPLNTAALASRWFYRRRGLALGLAALATSGGGLVVVPLLNEMILRHGWRLGLLGEAVIMTAIILTLAVVVLRDRPSDMGLDGHPENQGRQKVSDNSAGLPWRAVFASRNFWIPSLTLAAISGTCQAMVITLVPYGVQLHISPTSAALLISAFAAAAATTKVIAGLLADRMDKYLLLVAAAFFMTLSWLALSLFTAYGALLAGSCLGGIALGCALPTAAGLIAAWFGSARFGRVMGWAYMLVLLFAISAVRFIGFMYDQGGSYHMAFVSFAALLGALLLMTLLLAPGRRQPHQNV